MNVAIKPKIRQNIIHIVVSHHGQWGKVQPETKEAKVVSRADTASAKYHRVNTIGTNDFMHIFAKTGDVVYTSMKTGISEGIIKDRLERSKKAHNLENIDELINYYLKNKKVLNGDSRFQQNLKETNKLKQIVSTRGFYNLVMEIPLLNYLNDIDIFVI